MFTYNNCLTYTVTEGVTGGKTVLLPPQPPLILNARLLIVLDFLDLLFFLDLPFWVRFLVLPTVKREKKFLNDFIYNIKIFKFILI